MIIKLRTKNKYESKKNFFSLDKNDRNVGVLLISGSKELKN